MRLEKYRILTQGTLVQKKITGYLSFPENFERNIEIRRKTKQTNELYSNFEKKLNKYKKKIINGESVAQNDTCPYSSLFFFL